MPPGPSSLGTAPSLIELSRSLGTKHRSETYIKATGTWAQAQIFSGVQIDFADSYIHDLQFTMPRFLEVRGYSRLHPILMLILRLIRMKACGPTCLRCLLSTN